MNYLVICGVIVLSTVLLGCSSTYPKLHRVGVGSYEMVYEYYDVYEKFGHDRKKAIPAYLKAIGMLPPGCTNGIDIIRAGETEGGKAWAEFRCTER